MKPFRFYIDIHIGFRLMDGIEGPHCSGGSFRVVFEGTPKEKDGKVADVNWRAVRYKMLQWLGAKWNYRLLIWDKDHIYPAFAGYDPTIVPLPCIPTKDNLGEYLKGICFDQLQGYGCDINKVTLYQHPVDSSCPA